MNKITKMVAHLIFIDPFQNKDDLLNTEKQGKRRILVVLPWKFQHIREYKDAIKAGALHHGKELLLVILFDYTIFSYLRMMVRHDNAYE